MNSTHLFRIENNLCTRCGGDKTTDKRDCSKCLRSERERNRKRREDHDKLGRCTLCGNKRFHMSKMCEHHWVMNTINNNKMSKDLCEDLKIKLREQGFKCFYTSVQLIPGWNTSLDHIKPKSTNPHLRNDLSNLVWCTRDANSVKGTRTAAEFKEICYNITDRTYKETV